jgi:hypothetical protein
MFLTLLIALLVAFIATRRETKKQLAQRHFDFRDERAEIYASIIDALNKAMGAYFRFQDAKLEERPSVKTEADKYALELETSVQAAQIRVPEFVAHACLNANGRMQVLISQLGRKNAVRFDDSEFDQAKGNMLKVMKQDIRLIESTTSRTSYAKLSDHEGDRYFLETGFPAPSK